MSEQLKPCPFCGHKAIETTSTDKEGYIMAQIECSYCEIKTPMLMWSDALNLWNRRDTGVALQEVASVIATGFVAGFYSD